jgi:starch-binding outer membrane protein, SusD/RagB family
MRTTLFAIALLGSVAVTGCTDATVPDLNNPSIEGMTNNPTRAQVQALATGVVMGNRTSQGPQIRDLEIIGRDAYNLDAADPRWVSELLIQLDPGGFGGAHWTQRYRTIKGANVMIASVATASALSTAEKAAATGFAQTIKAYDLLSVLETRDVAGIAEDAGASTDDLAPLVCRNPALARISTLLDEAQTSLAAGGSAFPFVLPAGFDGFDTPASFTRFNRAIKARAEIYRGPSDNAAYTRALTALGQSFVDTTASLDLGVYHVYSLAAGDIANPLYQDPATTNFRAHPSVRSQAEPGDLRVAAKTAIGTTKTYQGVGSDIILTVYDGPTSPIPIIRNEELILLRAQANLGLNNLAAASRDINTIRVKSGGLTPRVHATVAEALNDLLQQKRYSLLFESGSRWVDARLYGRLNQLPIDISGHRVHPNYDVPQDEQLARGGSATCQ